MEETNNNGVRETIESLGVDLVIISKIEDDLGVKSVDDLSRLTEPDLISVGMKTIPARKLIAVLTPEYPAHAASVVSLDDVLPPVPSDASWLDALRTGGVLKVDQSTVISAIRAALAHRAGLYGIPEGLVGVMEKFADENEEQVDSEFFKDRKS